tara:strand:+ start:12481 stop:13143 length:663 start_codon:yes stop_codon:yes gene_type:complete
MLSDNMLALIASSVIKKGYNGNSLSWSGRGYIVTTLETNGHSNIVEVKKGNQKLYMFCQEGSQNTSDYLTDLEAMNNDKKKKVKNKNGRVSKTMWDEYTKYRNLINDFHNDYKNKGQLVLVGHSLGGAVVGIAAGMLNIKSVLLAPVPFMAHSNWSKNYNVNPKSYVNITDPCCSDRVGISWKAANHIGKIWISNGYGMDSHKIASFVSYFEDRCGFSIL